MADSYLLTYLIPTPVFLGYASSGGAASISLFFCLLIFFLLFLIFLGDIQNPHTHQGAGEGEEGKLYVVLSNI
jgi:hypothetical protein